jgi:hypothetical protein
MTIETRPWTHPRPRPRTQPGWLAIVLLALAGCDTSNGSDPRGADATFNFSWRINGQDPTAATGACAAAGVRFIRMTFVDDQNAEHQYDAFRLDCNLGTYHSPRPELAAGTYRLYWEAIGLDGRRVSLAEGNYVNGQLVPRPERVTVVRGGNVDFDASNRQDDTFTGQPTNFSTGAGPLEVTLAWAATRGATPGTDCATAGVATVSWTLRLSNGVPVETHDAREACEAFTRIRWDQVNFDNYILDVRGFGTGGAMGWSSRCTGLLATATDGGVSRRACLVDRVSQ